MRGSRKKRERRRKKRRKIRECEGCGRGNEDKEEGKMTRKIGKGTGK